MTHYATGTRFEHKTIADLEANGYEVIRAAGSKGGTKADIAAFKPGQLLLVQCKRAGALPPAEWDRLVEVAGWVGALAILAANGPAGRGVTYTRLLGPKIPRARRQPCEPFVLDQVDAFGPSSATTADRLGIAEENLAATRYQRDEVAELLSRFRAFVSRVAQLQYADLVIADMVQEARQMLAPPTPTTPFGDDRCVRGPVTTVALPAEVA